jgi:hypothetical protein
MRLLSLIALGIGLTVSFLVFLTCQESANPFDPSEAKISLFLLSSSKQVSETSITDTVGNTDSIGLVLYLAQHIDSVTIVVRKGDSVEFSFTLRERISQIDTVYYAISFASAGDRTVTATGYVKNELNPFASATIHIIARPQENQKPSLTITGTRVITAGQTVQLQNT